MSDFGAQNHRLGYSTVTQDDNLLFNEISQPPQTTRFTSGPADCVPPIDPLSTNVQFQILLDSQCINPFSGSRAQEIAHAHDHEDICPGLVAFQRMEE